VALPSLPLGNFLKWEEPNHVKGGKKKWTHITLQNFINKHTVDSENVQR
jgi:hypothetical protein